MILGIDEVGRGPWAGPLVVGAVVLGNTIIDGLTDSKKLSKKRRELLDIVIREQASGYGLGWVTAGEIDEIGLSNALILATKRAVEQIATPYHEIIIDGTVNFLKDTNKGRYVTTIKKADLLISAVSAASIIAKVARDNYMKNQAELYPGYGFASHVGYGTVAHSMAIEKLGVTPLHRLSFSPLSKYAKNTTTPKTNLKRQTSSIGYMTKIPSIARATSKEIGDNAEDEATNYLVRLGHDILNRNWKTKFCEIDIVSVKDEVVYFTEVKYRRNAQQGGGFAAITPKKQRQMKFAAEYYALKNNLNNTSMRLAAMSITGNQPTIDSFLELV